MEKQYTVPYIYERISGKKNSGAPPVRVSVPGSKSITNRALLLATLAQGTSTLRGVLFSDDSRHFLQCIQTLGFETSVDEKHCIITATGHGGAVPRKEASLYVGSAGTAARFLTAYLGVSQGCYHMDASPQMRRRPMAPLLEGLTALGCQVTYPDIPLAEDTLSQGDSPFYGHFPFTLHGHGFGRNHICVNIDHSSQFLSALLISACLSREDFTIQVEGNHGMAYIDMTCRMMSQFGIETLRPTPDSFLIKSGQTYKALDYQVEPDVSAACYFYALVPLLRIPVLVEHVHFASLQGDVAFLHILEATGCTPRETDAGILLLPPESEGFHGVNVDMSACSDQAITLAAIAPFADSPTTIKGIGHIRYQESNRIEAIVTELGKMGIRCDTTDNSITIYPDQPKPSLVETYEDHRMAMGFALIGLRAPGIVIDNPDCCRKTFEDYFQVLQGVLDTLA